MFIFSFQANMFLRKTLTKQPQKVEQKLGKTMTLGNHGIRTMYSIQIRIQTLWFLLPVRPNLKGTE